MKSGFIFLVLIILNSTLGWAIHKTRVLLVSAESTGIFQTGGLAHAVAGLASAFNEEGIHADIAMPFYLQMSKIPKLIYTEEHLELGLDFQNGLPQRSEEFFVLKADNPKYGDTLFFRHNRSNGNYFDNRRADGRKVYGPEESLGEAFGAWSKAVSQYILSQNYDVIILNDWHSALVALFLDKAKQEGHKVPKIVTAIHNLAFQGLYPATILDVLGIPHDYFGVEHGIEFYGQVNFLKAAILLSDLVYTVSPNYAEEISTPLFGAGLDGLIRKTNQQGRLVGILNGIDNAKWDPAKPVHEVVQWPFNIDDLGGKSVGKAALQKEIHLAQDPGTPIFILTSRIAEQKGYEYLPLAIEQFVDGHDVQFVIIGDGDHGYIQKILDLQKRYPDKIRYQAFSERSEKFLKAYGDFFINAAWFEPSGLNQMFALKNGTIPILSRVGGLSNSVHDGQSGFLFDIIWKDDHSGYDLHATARSLNRTLVRAYSTFKSEPEKVLAMRREGMKIDNSWNSRVRNEFHSVFEEYLRVPISRKVCVEALHR